MKFSKTLLFGIFSVLLLIFFVIYRRDNMLQVFAAFFALCWFVQLPGGMILMLLEGKTENYLRVVLLGNVIGLALVPLLYYGLYYFGLHESFVIVITCLNVLLGIILMIRINKKQLQFSLPGKATLNDAILLFFIVMMICSIREFSQMLSWNFVFNSKRDTDAGTLMSMVTGIKNYGSLVNMNYSSVPINYHHFIYLLMALVMKSSHIGILPLYQVVFPLYSFFFMVMAAYYLAVTLKASHKVAILCAVSLLLLDDFYFLNQLIKFLTGKQPFFTIESIGWLHNGPSTVISLMMLFVIVAELSLAETQKIKNAWIVILTVSIGTLACYKISTWACLVGGMAAASVFTFRKNPKLVVLTIFSIASGLIVNKFLSGFAPPNLAADGTQVNIAYPLLRSDAVRNFLHVSNDVLTFHDLSFKIVGVLVLLSVFYLIGIFGVRLFYFSSKIKEGVRKINFTSLVIVFSVIGGTAISFLVTPKIGAHNALYFILTGMYLLSVVSVPAAYEFISEQKKIFLKGIVICVVAIQLVSGVLQVLQPVTNPVKGSALSPGWFEAMDYLKTKTDQHALLAYNRFQLKENYYKDDFDFVPVFAERAVVTGGRQYFPDYESRKAKVDSLFSSSSIIDVKRISSELKLDFLVYDKWKGGTLPCKDTVDLLPVFTNQQVDIYRVKKD